VIWIYPVHSSVFVLRCKAENRPARSNRMNMTLRYLSPAKFAELTGISKLRALRMVEEGKIKALEIEGKTLIDIPSFYALADAIEAQHKNHDLFAA
jgi:hypothetical protein